MKSYRPMAFTSFFLPVTAENRAGLASWAYDLCSHSGLCAQKGSMLHLMLCCQHVEFLIILYLILFGKWGPVGQWNLCWGPGALADVQALPSHQPCPLPPFPWGWWLGQVGEEEAHVLLSPSASCCGLGTVSERVGVGCLHLAVSWGVVGANPAPGWKHTVAFGGWTSSSSPLQVSTVLRCEGLNNAWTSLSMVCRGRAVGRGVAWLCFPRALVWLVIRGKTSSHQTWAYT